MANDPLQKLFALIAGQFGVFHRDQARRLGITDRQLHGLIQSGRVVRVLPSVYRDIVVAPSWPQKLKAAELWSGTDGCICGRSAAAWWGLDGIDLGSVEVYARKKGPKGIKVHRSPIDAKDMREKRGLRVTAVERTIADIAGSVTSDRLEAALHDALRKRMTVAPRLREALGRAGTQGRRGAAALRGLLTDVESAMGFFGSRFEVVVKDILVNGGLPAPVRQFPLTDGLTTIHPDLAYPEARLMIEADSFSCHGTKEAFCRDRDRDNFARSRKWDTIRLTWWDTKKPGYIPSLIRSFLYPALPTGTR